MITKCPCRVLPAFRMPACDVKILSDPVFVNLLRSPGIDSQPGGIDSRDPGIWTSDPGSQ